MTYPRDFYTFGLEYPNGDFEEIDVRASNYADAKANAEHIAARDYSPGWTLVDMPAGGTGGMAIILGR